MEPRQTVGALQIEDPRMEELSEKNLHWQEGSKMPSRAESKSHTPPESLGSSPFPGRDLSPQKGGKAEVGEECYRDGKRDKARTQAGGGPEVS